MKSARIAGILTCQAACVWGVFALLSRFGLVAPILGALSLAVFTPELRRLAGAGREKVASWLPGLGCFIAFVILNIAHSIS